MHKYKRDTHTHSQYALSFRVQKLNEATRKTSDGCIKLDSSQYDMFTETPRNYSLIVVATALDPKMGCEPCRCVHEWIPILIMTAPLMRNCAWPPTRTLRRLARHLRKSTLHRWTLTMAATPSPRYI
jgi:hypothetical protein